MEKNIIVLIQKHLAVQRKVMAETVCHVFAK